MPDDRIPAKDIHTAETTQQGKNRLVLYLTVHVNIVNVMVSGMGQMQ